MQLYFLGWGRILRTCNLRFINRLLKIYHAAVNYSKSQIRCKFSLDEPSWIMLETPRNVRFQRPRARNRARSRWSILSASSKRRAPRRWSIDRPPSSGWFAAIRGAQKVKDVEDCVKNTAAPPLNSTTIIVRAWLRAMLRAGGRLLLCVQQLCTGCRESDIAWIVPMYYYWCWPE